MSWPRRLRMHPEARLEAHPSRPGQSRWVRGGDAVALPTPVAELLAGLDGQRSLAELAGPRAEAFGPVMEVLLREGLAEDLGPEPLLARDGLRHRCHGCGWSCQGHFIGPLDEDYLARAEAVHAAVVAERPGLAGLQPIVQRDMGNRRISGLAVLPDGGCLYLDEQGCSVHRILGPEAKPDGCRLYPLELLSHPAGLRVAVSPGCARAHREAPPGDLGSVSGLALDRLPSPPRRPGDLAEEAALLEALGEGAAGALRWLVGGPAPFAALLAAAPVRELGSALLAEHGARWSQGRSLWARKLRYARELAFGQLRARPLSSERDAWVTRTIADAVWVRAYAPLGGLRPGLCWSLLSATLANALAPGDALDDPFGESLALGVRLGASCPAVARMLADPGLIPRIAALGRAGAV